MPKYAMRKYETRIYFDDIRTEQVFPIVSVREDYILVLSRQQRKILAIYCNPVIIYMIKSILIEYDHQNIWCGKTKKGIPVFGDNPRTLQKKYRLYC